MKTNYKACNQPKINGLTFFKKRPEINHLALLPSRNYRWILHSHHLVALVAALLRLQVNPLK